MCTPLHASDNEYIVSGGGEGVQRPSPENEESMRERDCMCAYVCVIRMLRAPPSRHDEDVSISGAIGVSDISTFLSDASFERRLRIEIITLKDTRLLTRDP